MAARDSSKTSKTNCVRCGTRMPANAEVCPACKAVHRSAERTEVLPAWDASTQNTAPLPAFVPGQVVLEGKWQLEAVLGTGGMGTVYRARDLALDRVVAIKLLSNQLATFPEFINRFEREARMMAKLEHPNLVPIHAVGQQAGCPFLVMKYLEGAPLDAHALSRGGRLPANEVLAISRQVCAGLSFIHAQGLIHRDLKPANLFVSPEGQVTILDLGLARPQHGEGLTRSGAVVGTPGYMAPEQVSGTEVVDHRADVYALGVILFELITGVPPFQGGTDFDIMLAHRSTPVPDPRSVAPDVPAAVAALLRQALAKDKAQRFDSATALLEGLEKAYAAGVAPAPPVRRSRWKDFALPVGIAGGSVLLLIVAAWLLFGGEEAPGPPLIEVPLAEVAPAKAPPPELPPAKVPPPEIIPAKDPPPRVAPAKVPLAEAPLSEGPVAAVLPSKTTPPKAAGKPSCPSGATGVLQVNANPWGELTIDDRKVESGNFRDWTATLSCGRHRLQISNPNTGRSVTEVITVRANGTMKKTYDLRPKR